MHRPQLLRRRCSRRLEGLDIADIFELRDRIARIGRLKTDSLRRHFQLRALSPDDSATSI